jgi:hypothetical protein
MNMLTDEKEARQKKCWKKIGRPPNEVLGNYQCEGYDCMAWITEDLRVQPDEDNPAMGGETIHYGRCGALARLAT